jgi:hypothetical protein
VLGWPSTFEGGDLSRLGEVLLHAEPGRHPWDEWLSPDLDWPARRSALLETPLPEREDWYSRLLIAKRH